MTEAKKNYQKALPYIVKFRNFLFGSNVPDIYSQITFFINLSIWFIFLLWNILGLIAIVSRDFILLNKGVSVEGIISQRANALGYSSQVLLTKLETLYILGIIAWISVFVGLVLIYRKRIQFWFFSLVPIIIYILYQIFGISFTYFLDDTTNFDKVALLIGIVSQVIFYFMLKGEKNGRQMSFFGE